MSSLVSYFIPTPPSPKSGPQLASFPSPGTTLPNGNNGSTSGGSDPKNPSAGAGAFYKVVGDADDMCVAALPVYVYDPPNDTTSTPPSTPPTSEGEGWETDDEDLSGADSGVEGSVLADFYRLTTSRSSKLDDDGGGDDDDEEGEGGDEVQARRRRRRRRRHGRRGIEGGGNHDGTEAFPGAGEFTLDDGLMGVVVSDPSNIVGVDMAPAKRRAGVAPGSERRGSGGSVASSTSALTTNTATATASTAPGAVASQTKNLWMPDSLCPRCYSCTSPFTLLNRRHHCRLCGQVFCGNCTRGKVKGVGRVCKDCEGGWGDKEEEEEEAGAGDVAGRQPFGEGGRGKDDGGAQDEADGQDDPFKADGEGGKEEAAQTNRNERNRHSGVDKVLLKSRSRARSR